MSTTTINRRPILFRGRLVRGILEGRKSQTRRVITPQPYIFHSGIRMRGLHVQWGWAKVGHLIQNSSGTRYISKMLPHCPYGQPGDRLWVRETFALRTDLEEDASEERRRRYVIYRADTDDPSQEAQFHPHTEWRPSIFMPRWACRLELEILKVRIERLQDITEKDAGAEGVQIPVTEEGHWLKQVTGSYIPEAPTYREHFHVGWDEINAKRGFGWDANPWVWALDFKRVK